jgi:hypothetical protein
MVRRHRLIEAYLVATLGYTWDTVHDEAERLEHAVSDTLVERMAAVLGHPTVDPHGDPIPSVDGSIEEPDFVRLADVPPGDTVELRRVDESQPERLRYIASVGLTPGAAVTVVDRQPFTDHHPGFGPHSRDRPRAGSGAVLHPGGERVSAAAIPPVEELSGWRYPRPSPSLPESHASVRIPRNVRFWRKALAFAGPGYMVAVGYMDPGNWATDLAGGAPATPC